jgi:hypothetical protein
MIEALEYARVEKYGDGHEETFWAGIIADHEEMNGSGETREQMREYVLVAYNRDNPDQPATAEDLQWTELTERPGWA